MSGIEPEATTPPEPTATDDDAVDIEPILRRIIQEENTSVGERLTKLEEALGPLGELGDTLEGLFKKHKTPATKIDEDSLVEKILGKLKEARGSNPEGGESGEGKGAKRSSGPLSRFLGIG